jgi:hypothetical protein
MTGTAREQPTWIASFNLVGSQSNPKMDEHVSANAKLLSGLSLILCGSLLAQCIDKLNFLQTSDNCEIAQ